MAASLVKWNDPGVEPHIQDENAKINELHEIMTCVQMHNLAHHRHGFRATHVKSQAIVKGRLTVKRDLPAHLAQGLFSNDGATYPVAIRYANEPSFLTDDRAPGPRGCGLKVFNVAGPGPFMDPTGAKTRTQDFTFNNAPILELKDLATTVEIMGIRERNFSHPEKIEAEVRARPDKDLQLAPKGLPNHHFLSYTMYSQSAYRFGENIVKYALFPAIQSQRDLGDSASITEHSDREQHSIWLSDHFREHDAVYEFRVQLCRDLSKQSVEDASMEWDEKQYPFETVATITFPRGQDVGSHQRRAFWDDRMALNVWHGLEAHQPLGSVNRLRKSLYAVSVAKRVEMNSTPIEPVSNMDQIP
ncbi:hypothetical protein ANO11243_009860 [Dothideomycetidae sp. 11243]|nr:hypothetical protein ANO11243_009860 [fungal sp. No.11243]